MNEYVKEVIFDRGLLQALVAGLLLIIFVPLFVKHVWSHMKWRWDMLRDFTASLWPRWARARGDLLLHKLAESIFQTSDIRYLVLRLEGRIPYLIVFLTVMIVGGWLNYLPDRLQVEGGMAPTFGSTLVICGLVGLGCVGFLMTADAKYDRLLLANPGDSGAEY
jgi:hypothetical protein